MSAPQPPAEAQPDPSFAEWLATEMPAGTVIGDPAWWANRIARQYAKRRSPAEAQAQGGGEVVEKPCRRCGHVVFAWANEEGACCLDCTAHPSARVGVEALRAEQAAAVMPLVGPLLDAWERVHPDDSVHDSDIARYIEPINRAMQDDTETGARYSIDADPAGIRARVADAITGALAFGAQGSHPPPSGHWLEPFWDMARAEAQAQGGGEVVEWDDGSPCMESRPIGMVYPVKPDPRASGYLDSSGVEWSAYDTGQMEAYARAAYSDGWSAGYRAAVAQQPAPPSAPVGVEGREIAEYDQFAAIVNALHGAGETMERAVVLARSVAAALAQQPAAVDVPEVVSGIPVSELIDLGTRYAREIEKRGMPRAAQVLEGLVMLAAANQGVR